MTIEHKIEASKAANLAAHEKQILDRMAADARQTCIACNVAVVAVLGVAAYVLYCVFQASPLAR